MIYIGLKFIIRIALNVFFRTITIRYAESIPKDRPLIIVANHPSTFMDAIAIGAAIQQPLYFLAKGSLFTNRFLQFLFSLVHMIPIYRSQDDPTLMSKNEDIFKRCYHFLSKGKALLIFPEGISRQNRRLHKIKTGAARIALGAEQAYGYPLNVAIVPVGLNYSDVGKFRSDLFLSFGHPISVSRFCDEYRKDERKAVHALTDHIREHLEEITIHIETEKMNTLVAQIEIMYKRNLSDDLGFSLKDKTDNFKITKGIVDAIRYFNQHEPLRVSLLFEKITRYMTGLSRFHLKDEQFNAGKSRGSLSWDSIKNMLFFMAGFPIYLYGIASNYLPYKLTDMLGKKISGAIEYQGPVKLILGAVIFPAYYAFLIWHVSSILLFGWFTMLLAVVFPFSGLFAITYWDCLRKLRSLYHMFSLFYRQNTWIATLVQQRLDIMNCLKTAQKDYITYMVNPDAK